MNDSIGSMDDDMLAQIDAISEVQKAIPPPPKVSTPAKSVVSVHRCRSSCRRHNTVQDLRVGSEAVAGGRMDEWRQMTSTTLLEEQLNKQPAAVEAFLKSSDTLKMYWLDAFEDKVRYHDENHDMSLRHRFVVVDRSGADPKRWPNLEQCTCLERYTFPPQRHT